MIRLTPPEGDVFWGRVKPGFLPLRWKNPGRPWDTFVVRGAHHYFLAFFSFFLCFVSIFGVFCVFLIFWICRVFFVFAAYGVGS
jgi:hypothetical protein